MSNYQITEYSQAGAAIAILQEKYGKPFAVSTPKGMAEAKEARAEIRGYRVTLEKLRAELKAPVLERSRLIDSEAKRITTELLAIEDPIDAAIKAEERRKEEEKAAKEREEKKRVEEINRKIDAMRLLVVKAAGEDLLFTKGAISWVELYQIEPAEFLEFLPNALAVKAETLATLNKMASEKELIEGEKKRLAELQRQIEAERQRQTEENRKIEAQRAAIERQQREVAEREARAKREADERAQVATLPQAPTQEPATTPTNRKISIGAKREAEIMASKNPLDELIRAVKAGETTIDGAIRDAYALGVIDGKAAR